MDATAKAMIIVRQLWYVTGCLMLLKGAGHA